MNYEHYFLGRLSAGKKISVKTNQDVVTMLVDDGNFMNYSSNIPYRSYNETQHRYPKYISVPYTNKWHILIFPLQNDRLPASTILFH